MAGDIGDKLRLAAIDKPMETADLREAIYKGQEAIDWVDNCGGWGVAHTGVRVKASVLRALVGAAKEYANQ